MSELGNSNNGDGRFYQTFSKYKHTTAGMRDTLRRSLSDAAAALDLNKVNRIVPKFAYSFVPQYVRSRWFNDTVAIPDLDKASWIDGLRGLAIVCLFNFHFLYAFTDVTVCLYDIPGYRWVVELPIVRLPFSGRCMLAIFFVTAGFQISRLPLDLIRRPGRDSQTQFLQLMSQTFFRLYFRIYLPVGAIMLIVAVATYLGAYNYSRGPMMNLERYFPGIWKEAHLYRFPTIKQQLEFWWKEFSRIMYVHEWGKFYPAHDDHLHVMRMAVQDLSRLCVALLAFSWTRPLVRMTALLFFSYWWTHSERWEMTLCFWGACLAEISLMRERSRDGQRLEVLNLEEGNSGRRVPAVEPHALQSTFTNPHTLRKTISRTGVPLGTWIWSATFLAALWFMSAPSFWEEPCLSTGYMFIINRLPYWMLQKHYVIPSVGAAMLFGLLTLCDPTTSVCLKLLNKPLPQYTGRLALAIYLVHGPVLHVVGYMVPHMIWAIIGKRALLSWCVGMGVGWAVSLALVLWAAEVFEREIHQRCVSFITCLERVISSETFPSTRPP